MSTDSITQRISFNPTISRESTQYSEEGNWFDGDKIRFRKGKVQNIRGYQKKLKSTYAGKGRDIITFRSLEGKRYISWATESLLHLYYGGVVYDITPVSASVSLPAGNITTSTGSFYVHVSNAGHGRKVGDYMAFVSTSVLAGVTLQGNTYRITSAGTNTFQVSAQNSASSNVATGATSFVYYNIASGTSISTPGLGYGANTYNTARASVTVGGVVTLGGWNAPADESAITLNIRQWSLDVFGENLLATPREGRIYQWIENNGPSKRAIEIPTTTTAAVSTGVPLKNNFVLVSPRDRHVISLGCTDLSGTFDPMILRFSDQANLNEWTPSVSTTADQIRLGDGSQLIGGVKTRDAVMVFSDTAAYAMQFVGPPFTFNVDLVGSNCGLIAPHAAAADNDLVFWMGIDNFYMFDGSVKILPCSIRDYVFSDINFDELDKVYAAVNQEFQEIVWLYPTADSSECNRYVLFGRGDGTSAEPPYWTYGDGIFSTWADRNIFESIHVTGTSVSLGDQFLIENEPKGVYTADTRAMHSFIESSYFDIPFGHAGPNNPEGDFIMFMDRIIPDFDFDGTNAQTSIRLTTKRFPQSEVSVTKGPYTVRASTEKISLRVRGRQAKIRVDASIEGTSWRLSDIRIDVQADGKR
jgi:hypothetical protein